MASVNRVVLLGNLTRDPVLRATESGLQICEIGIAVNRHWRTAQGEDREDACFVDMDAFGRLAEVCSHYIHKGSLVYVEGRLRFDQWQDKATGQNRSKLKVTIESIQFLDRKDNSQGGDGTYNEDGTQQAPGGYQQQPPAPGGYQQQPPAPGGYQQRQGAYQQRQGGYQQRQQPAGYQQQPPAGYQQQPPPARAQQPVVPPTTKPMNPPSSPAAGVPSPIPQQKVAAESPSANAPAEKTPSVNSGDEKAPIDDMPF